MDGAASIHVLGLTIYVYGLYLGAGCLLAGGLLFWLCRQDESHRRFALLAAPLAMILGLFMARLVWVMAEVQFQPFLSVQNALNLKTGGLSMFGALFGAALGGMLAARLAGLKVAKGLDRLLPALLLFVAVARLGEGYTQLGISRPLVSGVLNNSFLALKDEYDAYLRTYLLESIMAVVLMLVALLSLKRRKPLGTSLLVFLCFGLSQNLFESLRYDGHLRFSFIGLQQVLAVVLFGCTLIWLAVRVLKLQKDRRLAIISLALLPLILGGMLFLEFKIDRSELSKWLTYGIYVLLHLLPLGLGLKLLRQGGYDG